MWRKKPYHWSQAQCRDFLIKSNQNIHFKPKVIWLSVLPNVEMRRQSCKQMIQP